VSTPHHPNHLLSIPLPWHNSNWPWRQCWPLAGEGGDGGGLSYRQWVRGEQRACFARRPGLLPAGCPRSVAPHTRARMLAVDMPARCARRFPLGVASPPLRDHNAGCGRDEVLFGSCLFVAMPRLRRSNEVLVYQCARAGGVMWRGSAAAAQRACDWLAVALQQQLREPVSASERTACTPPRRSCMCRRQQARMCRRDRGACKRLCPDASCSFVPEGAGRLADWPARVLREVGQQAAAVSECIKQCRALAGAMHKTVQSLGRRHAQQPATACQ